MANKWHSIEHASVSLNDFRNYAKKRLEESWGTFDTILPLGILYSKLRKKNNLPDEKLILCSDFSDSELSEIKAIALENFNENLEISKKITKLSYSISLSSKIFAFVNGNENTIQFVLSTGTNGWNNNWYENAKLVDKFCTLMLSNNPSWNFEAAAMSNDIPDGITNWFISAGKPVKK